jgi:hypothetical protein
MMTVDVDRSKISASLKMNANEEKQEKNLAIFWTDFLRKEFEHETDRGAVVLTASLLENALTNILKRHLVPSSNNDDELFENPLAPLSSFGTKIQISQRLGLISTRLARDLNIVRKMRNEFAHNVHGSTLESGKIKDLLTNLITSSDIAKNHDPVKNIYPQGARGNFLKVTNLTLFHLQSMVEGGLTPSQLKPLPDEWIYTWSYAKPKEENFSPTKEQPKLLSGEQN